MKNYRSISDGDMFELIIAVFLVLTLCVSKINSQDKKIRKINEELKSSRIALEFYKDAYRQSMTRLPEGTIDAVKCAMINNHPDNGGDIDKFILYRRCYENLTGRK